MTVFADFAVNVSVSFLDLPAVSRVLSESRADFIFFFAVSEPDLKVNVYLAEGLPQKPSVIVVLLALKHF